MSRYGSRETVTAVSFTLFMTEMHSDAGTRVFGIGEVRQKNALIRNIDYPCLGQHMAWWFSERYDEVSRWTGQLTEIPGDTVITQSV